METTYAGINLGDFTWITGENFVKIYETLSGGAFVVNVALH